MQDPHRIEDEAIATEAVDVGTLLAENASLRDRLMRALAEAENRGRRAERANEDARKFAITEFAREILLVVDNLQRTVAAAAAKAPSTAENVALVEGVQATLRILVQTLGRFGVRPVEPLGQKFDPNLHEAVATIAEASQPSGTVARVGEEGYMIHGRLLRPARVVISIHPSCEDIAPNEKDPAPEQPAAEQR
jgi:molecular chaperone GrpE